jgi:hypothetical protein
MDIQLTVINGHLAPERRTPERTNMTVMTKTIQAVLAAKAAEWLAEIIDPASFEAPA